MVAEGHGWRVKVPYKAGDRHHIHQLTGLQVEFRYGRLLVALLFLWK